MLLKKKNKKKRKKTEGRETSLLNLSKRKKRTGREQPALKTYTSVLKAEPKKMIRLTNVVTLEKLPRSNPRKKN